VSKHYCFPVRTNLNLNDPKDVPLSTLVAHPVEYLPELGTCVAVCRLGNDSQIAANVLRGVADSEEEKENIKDLIGGLVAWNKTVDSRFPIY
jgi:adenylyltransferase and sulfurtransferase